MVLAFLLTCGLTIFFGIFGLYALEKFAYGPSEVSILFMAFGLMAALSQGVFAGPLIQRWGEELVIKYAFLGTFIGFIGMSLASTYLALLLTIGFFTLNTSLLTPAVSALTSKRTTMEQGITMGVSNAFMSLGRIVGPLWAGLLFDVYIEYPYFSGAAIMLIGFVISLLWLTGGEKEDAAAQVTIK